MDTRFLTAANRTYLRWFIPFSICSIWIAAPMVISFIVNRNARVGVYGISDATIIPIMVAVYFFVLGLPYFAFFTIAAFRGFYLQARPWHFEFTPRELFVLALFLFGIWQLADHIRYWFSWDHIPICIVYSLAIIWLVWVRPMAAIDRDLIPPTYIDYPKEKSRIK